MRYIAVIAVLWAVPALALDTIQDCKTYGPHSSSCARAIQNRDSPEAVVKRMDQEQQRRDRERYHAQGAGKQG